MITCYIIFYMKGSDVSLVQRHRSVSLVSTLGYPPPVPNNTKKCDIFNIADYAEIDKKAAKVRKTFRKWNVYFYFSSLFITSRVRSTTGRYCFHRCLSVHRGGDQPAGGGGGVRSVQPGGGQVRSVARGWGGWVRSVARGGGQPR